MRPRCYVASPLGFTASGRLWNAEVLLPALREVVEPVDPWAPGAAPVEPSRKDWLEIGRRNAEAVRGSDLLVAVLDGQEADSGTVAELGYAAALGKRCFGLRTDARLAGEPGMALNLQVEWFVVESGGRVCSTLDELVAALRG